MSFDSETSRGRANLPLKYNINVVFRTTMEKLDYTYWRPQFETVLELHELTQVVKEDAPLLAAEDNLDYEEWRRPTCQTWIKFTVATSVQQMIVSCKTAKEAWDRLQIFLSPLCVIHVKNLCNKLRTAKKTPEVSD